MTDIPKSGILIFLEERDGRLSNISYEMCIRDSASSMKTLVTSFFVASVVAAIYTVKDKVYDPKGAIAAFLQGMAQMMEACVILVLAWSIAVSYTHL